MPATFMSLSLGKKLPGNKRDSISILFAFVYCLLRF